MDKPEDKKICPECGSQIPISAKRCPFCRKNLRSWPRRHPIMSFLIFSILFSSVIVSLGSKDNEPTQTTIQYAYNATNGAFQGRIVNRKTCTNQPSIQCYEVSRGTVSGKNDEHPVSNVVVRSYKPTTPPDWYTGTNWESWE